MQETLSFKIQRQDTQDSSPYWENFVIPYKPNSNVISCLMDIQKNPVTAEGKEVYPVVWECNCLEEVCGACTMVINGKVRQACSALVDQLEKPITLQPMSKFPAVRDLAVDRSRIFAGLKKLKAWIPVDGYYDLGAGYRLSEEHQDIAYKLSECMTCGCCVEACPQYTKEGNFLGAAPISQARLFNMHPVGKTLRKDRLAVLMGEEGVANCGNAQNCVEVCPKSIPLTESIAEIGKQSSHRMLEIFFRR